MTGGSGDMWPMQQFTQVRRVWGRGEEGLPGGSSVHQVAVEELWHCKSAVHGARLIISSVG
jgi:hypothetical protein